MNFLKGAAKFIGWLTGFLAGIVAIIYACGYLIVQTRLHLLGIDVLLPSGREYYLHEGANFFIVTGQMMGFFVLGLISVALLVCIPWSITDRSEKGGKYLARIKNKISVVQRKYDGMWQGAILIAMVILLFFPILYNLDLFRAPLDLSGLLATSTQDSAVSSLSKEASKVRELLTTGETKRLEELYSILLMHCLFAGFLVAVMLRLTSKWPLKFLLTFPFLLVFMIYLFLLPPDFAVLYKRIEFPAVTIVSTVKDKPSNMSEDLLLLNKTDKEFILWNKTEEKALWIPLDKVARMEIGQAQPVFGKPLKGKEE